jgi:hypothetical protein
MLRIGGGVSRVLHRKFVSPFQFYHKFVSGETWWNNSQFIYAMQNVIQSILKRDFTYFKTKNLATKCGCGANSHF